MYIGREEGRKERQKILLQLRNQNRCPFAKNFRLVEENVYYLQFDLNKAS